DGRLTLAQLRLFEAREATEDLRRRAAEARAAHAAMVERAAGLAADVQRLEEAAAELDTRATSLAAELESTRRRVAELRTAIVAGEARLDADVRTLDALRREAPATSRRMRASSAPRSPRTPTLTRQV